MFNVRLEDQGSLEIPYQIVALDFSMDRIGRGLEAVAV